MEALLQTEEEKLRNELRADSEVDGNRKQSVNRLNETYSRILLKYNSAYSDDPLRQAIADSLTGVAREELDLLLAPAAKKEISDRNIRTGGIIGLLLALIFCLLAALLIQKYFLVGCVSAVCAVLSAFFGGKAWYGERSVSVRSTVDADQVLRILQRTGAAMDRKIEELCCQFRQADSPAVSASLSTDADISLLGDLLEALYSDNGEFALRQLKKLQPWLKQSGIEAINYSAETADLFEVLPSKKTSMTLRPALVSGEKLLLAGRATEILK